MNRASPGCPEYQRLSRRGLLRSGALAVGGLSLSGLLRHRALASLGSAASNDLSVILLWMDGGPSQHDTFDPKPDAPAEIRGDFGATSTSVPGIQFCDALPLTAKLADRLAIVRSMHHKDGLHEGGIHWLQTGYGYPGDFNPVDRRHPRNPAVGAVVAQHESRVTTNARRSPLPYVKIFKDGGYAHSYQGPAYLGPRFEPLSIGPDIRGTAFHEADPLSARHLLAPALELPGDLTFSRIENRQRVLATLDAHRRTLDERSAGDVDEFRKQAVELLTSGAAKQAFDLSQEDPASRERYGRHLWGQGALLARRLVEAGVRFVTVNLHGDPPIPSPFSWDTHVAHIPAMKEHLAPVFDRLFSALIDDLWQRGLSERVMVIAVGEFGRSPKIYSDGRPGGPGRGHWPQVFSAALAGGGVRGGQVIGASDAQGGEVKDRPCTPGDLWASVYARLGIDHHATLPGDLGRPTPILPEGQPIAGLFA